VSASSCAQFIYLCYARLLTMRLRQAFFFYLCVSELASVQTRPFYGECLIKAVLNAILQSPRYFVQCLIYSTLIISMKTIIL